MREGPLAELFRATEAAQGRTTGAKAPAAEQHDDSPPPVVPAPVAPARVSNGAHEPEDAEAAGHDTEHERAASRWLDPLPANPARLERSRENTSYLAVIRVVGVGGAGLNAL